MFSRNKILFNLNELIECMNIYDINRNSFFDFDNHRKKHPVTFVYSFY